MDRDACALRSVILTYHSIDDSGSVISTSRALFEQQMQRLAESGIPVVPLTQIQRQLGAVALTFDDGYRNFATAAWPVLRRLAFPATVFVVPEKAGLVNDWPALRGTMPRLELMDWAEIQGVAREGAGIGSHDLTHAPDLDSMEEQAMRRRLAASRSMLEERLGLPVRSFAYPYGFAGHRLRRVAAECYEACCTADLGFVTPDADPWLLPRVDAYYLRSPFWFRRLLRPACLLYLLVRGRLRRAREIATRTRAASRCASVT